MECRAVIMIPIPGKPLKEASSYRPISLLPIMNRTFEKAMLKRLRPILEEKRIIPDHQFGFRQKLSGTGQVHRNTVVIRGTLGITQASDKLWHPGLLFKI
jgi:hypothetical protein